MSEIINCDLVLLPEEGLTQKFLDASRGLSKLGSLFVLDNENFYAHMSLYMFVLSPDDLDKAENAIREIAGNHSAISAQSNKYSLGTGWGVGYLDPEYKATHELHEIQKSVVEKFNLIRAGTREKDKRKMEDAAGLKLENLKKYGYPAIGELFRPHVTITRLDDHKPEVLNELPEPSTFSGIFDRIGLYEMGDNGTCVREIYVCELADLQPARF